MTVTRQIQNTMRCGVALLALATLPTPGLAQTGEPTRLLRFPDLSGDRIAFTYAGDIWLASASGGTANRLTSHPGLELFARFSPDGQWIAFTGQYDGDEQVYVVPAAGGAPRQLTFYPAAGPLAPRWGYDYQVYGWSPDGKSVLFRSLRDGWDLGDTKLFLVDVSGGLPRALPMPESGGGDLSPDGKRVVYSPVTRDFRHWKRYEGGWAQDLWILDIDSLESIQVTNHKRSDRDPMWIGDTIYFSSDRDGTLNLYAYDTASGDIEQLTDEDRWDVRWPSADKANGRIVYEKAGSLEVFDIASGSARPVPIHVPTDQLARRPGRVSAANRVSGYSLSPKAKRAAFSARGDIFSVPIEHGPTRNLTHSSGANDRDPAWSPDGRRIAFTSDRSGETEIWVVDQDGNGEPVQLTEGSVGRHYNNLLWAPGSDRIAFIDQEGRLGIVDASDRSGDDAATGPREIIEVADDSRPFGTSYDWSPNGDYLAVELGDENTFGSIHLFEVESRTLTRVTSEMWNDFFPVFDPGGDYLYFLSDRQFQPQIGSFEYNYAADRETYIYALALREDTAHPFPPRSDEVEIEEDDEDGDANGEEDGDDGEEHDTDEDGDSDDGDDDHEDRDRIDVDGLAQRVARFPLEADNYIGLGAAAGKVLYVRGGAGYLGRSSDVQTEVFSYDLNGRESKSLARGIGGLVLSGDGRKLLVREGRAFRLLDVGGGEAKTLSLAGLSVDRVPAEEWGQIFDEVWRRFRDFFYAPNMHGYDWEALREQYRPLLAHVGHRSDLNYLMSEMVAELNVSHAYVSGGDYEAPDRPRAALLGARFEIDEDAGRYRIARIFEGQNEEPRYRSPLTEIGVGIDAGDYLFAIQGRELTPDTNPFQLLREAGRGPLELTVGGSSDRGEARNVLVDPIASEDALIYLAWTERSRRIVEELGGGRIGYLHIPDMSASGIREWIKWYYGQVRKDAMVVDVRSNGGGNVSPMIIERLRRETLMLDFERNRDSVDTSPGGVFHGHLVCVIDEDTASDGDQFAYQFRRAGLGPIVGKRSWGGVVGIYGRAPLIDGGSVNVPEAGSADPEGNWVIEGYGVDPDIEVTNLPRDILEGRDPQLAKAVELLLEKLAEDPRTLPGRPADPIKTP